MNNKRILIVFVILFLAAAIPWPFTAGEQTYLFGWLPGCLAYWWLLMIINLIFVLKVSKDFVKSNEKKEGESR
ncbi:MAG: hypothetical protein LKF50_07235 [Solobacterium sp.]|jgi:hypothetical protein|nr:hypothetical protein [Solobacterium sp.]